MTEPPTSGQPAVTAPTVTRPAPPPDETTADTGDHTRKDTEHHHVGAAPTTWPRRSGRAPAGGDRVMAGMDEVRSARVSLAVLFEPDSRPLHDLIAAHGIVETLHRLADGALPMPAVRSELRGLPASRLWELGARALDTDRGARIMTPDDADWPTALPDIAAVPAQPDRNRAPAGALCLWVVGDAPVAGTLTRSVTVVGSRACTPYGGHVASQLGYGLAEQGWTVVAGGGYGIEADAHKGAMAAGTSVAVLAYGLDRRYPTGNAGLLDNIADTGLLISLWPPGTPPLRHRFTANARALAALTGGTVVVEAARRSGALTVLREAITLGRAAMVVPGPVTSVQSTGTHAALREDSRVVLVTDATDVITELAAAEHRSAAGG